ncbi:unnamed protein product, partial [Prorocentrum cordatum]
MFAHNLCTSLSSLSGFAETVCSCLSSGLLVFSMPCASIVPALVRQAPTETVLVSAEYTAEETLPSGVTSSDLMSSTVYRSAKTTGLSAALSVPASDILVTGLTVAARRLSAAGHQLSRTVSVTTRFTVQVADERAAEDLSITVGGVADAIKAETDSAMAAADWSSELVITVAPVMTTPDVAIPIVSTTGMIIVTSTGLTESSPHCSWTIECTWDSATQAECAMALCQGQGYTAGVFVSASNDPCSASFTSSPFWYHNLHNFSVEYMSSSRPWGVAQITAGCSQKAPWHRFSPTVTRIAILSEQSPCLMQFISLVLSLSVSLSLCCSL